MFDAPKPGLITSLGAGFGAALTFSQMQDQTLTLHCLKDHVPDIADWLVGQGAKRVTSAALDYIFTDKNPLFERLSAKLPRA